MRKKWKRKEKTTKKRESGENEKAVKPINEEQKIDTEQRQKYWEKRIQFQTEVKGSIDKKLGQTDNLC